MDRIKPGYSQFYNLIEKQKFNSFSTSEKIRFCLEKGIFEILDMREDCMNSISYDLIDLEEFDNEEFRFDNDYVIENSETLKKIKSIITNPINYMSFDNTIIISQSFAFRKETYNAFIESIKLYSLRSELVEEINFNLKIVNDKKDEIEYLNSIIKEINPFKLKHIFFGHDVVKEGLVIFDDSEFLLSFNEIKFDWIIGKYNYKNIITFYKYSKLEETVDTYHKFFVAQYCYEKIKLIKNVKNKHIVNEKPPKFTNTEKKDYKKDENRFTELQAVYFLYKIGLITEMYSKLKNWSKIHEILGRLISRDTGNIAKFIRRVNLDDSLDSFSEQQDPYLLEIDEIIKSFRKLG